MATFYEKRHQRRKDTRNHSSLILLGNAGGGKSFLANVLAGRDSFIHAVSSKSVTQEVECIEIEMGSSSLTIFNVPGLIEAEQEHIDSNIAEIEKAFQERPNSMIIFVFGHEHGRIRDEDVAAFNAINAAYSFQPESLAIVVNTVPKNRPSDYERTTVPLLRKLLVNTNINSNNIYFIDAIDPNSIEEKEHLQDQLFQILMQLTPKIHQKNQTINTLMNELKICKEELVEQEELFDEERRRFEEEMEENQHFLNETIAEYRSETQSLRQSLNNQQQRIHREERRFHEQSEDQKRRIKQVTKEIQDIRDKYKRLQD